MEQDRFFDQITNPDYKEQFKEKLANVYKLGKKLAQESPDETDPLFEDRQDGPKAYKLNFHQESLIETGLPDDYLSGDLVFLDEYASNGKKWGNVIMLTLQRTHEVENITKFSLGESEELDSAEKYKLGQPLLEPTDETGTVIIQSYFMIHSPEKPSPESTWIENYSDWPLEISFGYENLQGEGVFPIFDKPANPLSVSGNGVDLHGADTLASLIKVEAKKRQIEI